MATSETAGKGLKNGSKAHGCFIDNLISLQHENFSDSTSKLELEKLLLSSDDTQIVKYILENAIVTPVYINNSVQKSL